MGGASARRGAVTNPDSTTREVVSAMDVHNNARLLLNAKQHNDENSVLMTASSKGPHTRRALDDVSNATATTGRKVSTDSQESAANDKPTRGGASSLQTRRSARVIRKSERAHSILFEAPPRARQAKDSRGSRGSRTMGTSTHQRPARQSSGHQPQLLVHQDRDLATGAATYQTRAASAPHAASQYDISHTRSRTRMARTDDSTSSVGTEEPALADVASTAAEVVATGEGENLPTNATHRIKTQDGGPKRHRTEHNQLTTDGTLCASKKQRKLCRSTESRSNISQSRRAPECWRRDMVLDSKFSMKRDNFDAAEYVAECGPFDVEHQHDTAFAATYVTDIYQRLYESEEQFQPDQYMEHQPHLNTMMRAILIDWLVEVHMKFRLVPDTMYLCVNIIDRYLSVVQIPRQKLQLVGVTALLVACKYEELFPMEVKDCVYITDRAYTKDEVVMMEAHIAKKLKFRLSAPTAFQFLQRMLVITGSGRDVRNLANYYSERMLQEYSAIRFRPSLVAVASISLAMNNPDLSSREKSKHLCVGDILRPGIPEMLLQYTRYSAAEICDVAKVIARKVAEHTKTYSRKDLLAVKKKFESSRYSNASINFANPEASHLHLPMDE